MKKLILLLTIVTFLLLAYINALPMYSYLETAIADREYWRTMASSPEWLCRARGGQFKWLAVSIKFDGTSTKQNWQCLEFVTD